MIMRKDTWDQIRGSLLGGAIGDALGYPVEFMYTDAIDVRFGTGGITQYDTDRATGKALISDDTQMTLFTANGILVGEAQGAAGEIERYVAKAYLDWLTTQKKPFGKHISLGLLRRKNAVSWLMDVPELYSRRAPGNTCMSSLSDAEIHGFGDDFLAQPCNHSKGCGGVMRVAPLALCYREGDIRRLDRKGAALCAITHGHPLGYLPGAVLTHILSRILDPEALSLEEIVREAVDTVCLEFSDRDYLPELRQIMEQAIVLSHNGDSDRKNIMRLGEGWVAEEALAIAVYCALRYEHDFSDGIIAAVNHNGDSDSTGAIAGNILGAIHGYSAIEDKWKQDLELRDVLLEMADDLYFGSTKARLDPMWERKYIRMRR